MLLRLPWFQLSPDVHGHRPRMDQLLPAAADIARYPSRWRAAQHILSAAPLPLLHPAPRHLRPAELAHCPSPFHRTRASTKRVFCPRWRFLDPYVRLFPWCNRSHGDCRDRPCSRHLCARIEEVPEHDVVGRNEQRGYRGSVPCSARG